VHGPAASAGGRLKIRDRCHPVGQIALEGFQLNFTAPKQRNFPTHPVVGEMFVDDFTHDCLLRVQHVRSKVEDDVEHAGLSGQSSAAMLRKWICHDLIVQVVRAKSAKHHVDERLTNCHSAASAHTSTCSNIFGQRIFTILHKHLLINTCTPFVVLCVTAQDLRRIS